MKCIALKRRAPLIGVLLISCSLRSACRDFEMRAVLGQGAAKAKFGNRRFCVTLVAITGICKQNLGGKVRWRDACICSARGVVSHSGGTPFRPLLGPSAAAPRGLVRHAGACRARVRAS